MARAEVQQTQQALMKTRPCPLHTAHLPATDDVRPCWLQLLPGRDKECVFRKFFLHVPSFISTTVTKYLDEVLLARTSCSWSINWSKRSLKVQSPVLTQDNGHGKVKSASKIQSSCELPPQRRTMADECLRLLGWEKLNLEGSSA